MKERSCIHGAKSTRVIRLSPKERERTVQRTAALEGWAYATVLSGPGVRVVTDSQGGPKVGETHLALDVYEN